MLDVLFIDGNEFTSPHDADAIKLDFKHIYEDLGDDPYAKDGIRIRAYTRYKFNESDGLTKDKDRTYFQTYESNNVDGGHKREFDELPIEFINHYFFMEIIKKDIDIIKKRINSKEFEIGVHAIRYIAKEGSPSYSSPIWLHKDDEELVFLHFLYKTENTIGGDSVISRDGKTIDDIKNLDKFMDTLVLTRDFLHAVTPIGSKESKAYRDILLVIVESKVQKL